MVTVVPDIDIGPEGPSGPNGPDRLVRRRIRPRLSGGDRAFRGMTRVSALVVLGVIAAIGLFLSIQAFTALRVAKFSFLTTQAWEPDVHHFGVGGIMVGTVLIALVAVLIAIPISLGLALFISEIAPQRLKRSLVSLVDLMAAIPSVVYGLWALLFLEGRTIGLSRWISTWFGWIPIFKVNGADASNPGPVGNPVQRFDIHRRDRRLPHGHPHPVFGHARGVLAGSVG